MAEELDKIDSVLKIAGNLQVNEWIEYQDYSKLLGSIDPALKKVCQDT
jgi:hypothetical protein